MSRQRTLPEFYPNTRHGPRGSVRAEATERAMRDFMAGRGMRGRAAQTVPDPPVADLRRAYVRGATGAARDAAGAHAAYKRNAAIGGVAALIAGGLGYYGRVRKRQAEQAIKDALHAKELEEARYDSFVYLS